MKYLVRSMERRLDPHRVLPGARSVVVVARPYPPAKVPPKGTPRVAAYAAGTDYHDEMERRLADLARRLEAAAGEEGGAAGRRSRAYVDHGPVLERSYAERAGVGFVGKSTMLITEEYGTYVFLGAVLTTFEVEPDPPATGTCGACTRCIDACPTGAIDEGGVDSNRCIAYLNIEKRGPFSEWEAKALGEWLFGCDVCQEVCPYNRTEAVRRAHPPIDLTPLAMRLMNDPTPPPGSAFARAGRAGLARNAEAVRRNLSRAGSCRSSP